MRAIGGLLRVMDWRSVLYQSQRGSERGQLSGAQSLVQRQLGVEQRSRSAQDGRGKQGRFVVPLADHMIDEGGDGNPPP